MSNCNMTVGVTMSHVKSRLKQNGCFKYYICLVLACDMVTPTDF